jgi:hypothetical protein
MRIEKLAPYAKAVAAFLIGLGSFLVILGTAVADSKVTTDEAVMLFSALTAWLGGTAGVYQVKNK